MSKQDWQAERRAFWQTLGRRYAHLLSPAVADARIALEYVLQHEVTAADCYANDPDPAGLDQFFIDAFTAELSDAKPSARDNK
jgi:hypothetical protein